MFVIIHGTDKTHWYQLVDVPEGTPKEKILDMADYSDEFTVVEEYDGSELEIVEPDKVEGIDALLEQWNRVMKFNREHGRGKYRGLKLKPHITYTLEVAEEE